MFKITQSPTFWQKVEAELTDENGRKVSVSFRACFKRYDQQELKDLYKRQSEANEDDAFAVRELVVDLDEVVDDENKPRPFSKELLDELLRIGLRQSLTNAFLAGQPRARVKA
jgi:tail assembly chaperone